MSSQLSLRVAWLGRGHEVHTSIEINVQTRVNEPKISIRRSFSLIPWLCTSAGRAILTLTATRIMLAKIRGTWVFTIYVSANLQDYTVHLTWKRNAHLQPVVIRKRHRNIDGDISPPMKLSSQVNWNLFINHTYHPNASFNQPPSGPDTASELSNALSCRFKQLTSQASSGPEYTS